VRSMINVVRKISRFILLIDSILDWKPLGIITKDRWQLLFYVFRRFLAEGRRRMISSNLGEFVHIPEILIELVKNVGKITVSFGQPMLKMT